jgi:hypothetical protein
VYRLLRLLPKRFLILALMGAAAAGAYLAAKVYSASIVSYVVEETLIQKAPPGMDPHLLRLRLQSGLAACPDKTARLKRLMEIAQTLEKTQRLTPDELESALKGCPGGQKEGRSEKLEPSVFPGV